MRIIGIDFGNTIASGPKDVKKTEHPDAIRVIKRLVDAENTQVCIISKVNAPQRVEVLTWLRENDFYNRTGLTVDDVYFCENRSDKGEICDRLGVTHHIDDRPEVMAYVGRKIVKYLYNPVPEDLVKFYNKIHNATIVANWLEIERHLFDKPLWRCRRCHAFVDMKAFRCECTTSPSPWEPVDNI